MTTTKDLTAFSFSSPAATGVISGRNIVVTVPIATDVTVLVATFSTTGASVAINGVNQIIGVTANDFSSVLTYTVTAQDASTKNYTVTVKVSFVTAAHLAELRRLVAEPTTTTYSDELLGKYIVIYPLPDGLGYWPVDVGFGTIGWTPTYDLHCAAADIWLEKAAAAAALYDFSADGGNFSRSQISDRYMKQVAYHRARRAPQSATLRKYPNEVRGDDYGGIGNLAEPRD